MLNPSAYALGANRSCIRDLFEYGCQRAAVVGRENVYDYSLGNPSIPSPKEVDETVRRILDDTDSLLIHGPRWCRSMTSWSPCPPAGLCRRKFRS